MVVITRMVDTAITITVTGMVAITMMVIIIMAVLETVIGDISKERKKAITRTRMVKETMAIIGMMIMTGMITGMIIETITGMIIIIPAGIIKIQYFENAASTGAAFYFVPTQVSRR